MRWSYVFIILFGLVSTFTMEIWSLSIFRALAGLGKGGAGTVSNVVLGESCPCSIRGKIVIFLNLFFGIGSILLFV